MRKLLLTITYCRDDRIYFHLQKVQLQYRHWFLTRVVMFSHNRRHRKTREIGAIFPRNNSLHVTEEMLTSIAFVSILVNLNGIFSGNFSLVMAT